MIKRIISILLILLCTFACLPNTVAFAEQTPPADSSGQIVEEGGYEHDQYVMVGKHIAATGAENVFDIKLEVVTQTRIEELYGIKDTAVVIVMDISNTMTSKLSDGQKRYEGAMAAAEEFLKSLQEKSAEDPGADIKVGFVAFNTDAHEFFDLSECRTKEQLADLVADMQADTDAIINAAGYKSSLSRYTNIEGGLARGKAMLDKVEFENEYIIFLSDGFPTTYLNPNKTDYKGYITSIGTAADGYDFERFNPNTEGQFYDSVRGLPCSWGTSYSDRGAIKAQDKATSIKDSGINIFSVGVGLGDQTIQEYIDDMYDNYTGDPPKNMVEKGFSVVDCTSENYAIGGVKDTMAYKNWLKDKIGSGYYYDSNDTAALKKAFADIFEKIESINSEKIEASWTVVDPMDMGQTSNGHIELISLFDKNGDFAQDKYSLEGKLGHDELGNPYENTATADRDSDTISWNLWKSGYTTIAADDVTSYVYELEYRIRLENETRHFLSDGHEGEALKTNGTTTLGYIHNLNGKLTPGTIDFPIPQVKGWLGQLRFTKLTNTGAPLPAAEFTLSHNENCSVCAAMYPGGWDVFIQEQIESSASPDGSVVFNNIPSGHDYTLTETKVPTGYLGLGALPVTVAYDTVTVNGKTDFESLVNFASCNLTVYKKVAGELPPNNSFGPKSFTIELRDKDNNTLREVSLPTEDNKWEYTFTGLPAGQYTLLETKCAVPQEGYVCKPLYLYPGNANSVKLDWGGSAEVTVQNVYEYVPDTVTVSAHKSWIDDNNRDGIRPQSIDFTLRVGGKDISQASAKADNGFKVSFEYDRRVYPGFVTVYESGYTDSKGVHHELELNGDPIPGYRFSLGEPEEKDASLFFEAYNIHDPETTSLSLKKEWTEEAAQNQKPITFRLYADGVEINSVTLDGKTGWEYTFNKDSEGKPLYKYSEGKEIEYTVEEVSPGEHWTTEKQLDENGVWVFTNDFHVPAKASVELSAKKYFNRRAPLGSAYSFLLLDEEGTVLQKVNNNGGNVRFEPLIFDAEGTYTFYVVEEKGKDLKVKYDTSRYTVTVDVVRERDYKAEVSVKLGSLEHEGDMAFFNSSMTSPPTGDKNNPLLMGALMLLSGAAAAGIVWLIRKKR